MARFTNAAGPLKFVSLFVACLVLVGSFEGLWRTYTAATAVVGFALTVWAAVSFARDAPRTGIAQRLLIVVYWAGVVLIGTHLVMS